MYWKPELFLQRHQAAVTHKETQPKPSFVEPETTWLRDVFLCTKSDTNPHMLWKLAYIKPR